MSSTTTALESLGVRRQLGAQTLTQSSEVQGDRGMANGRMQRAKTEEWRELESAADLK